MKPMRLIILFIALLLSAATLFGCGSSSDKGGCCQANGQPVPTTTITQAPAPAPTVTVVQDAMREINGTVRVNNRGINGATLILLQNGAEVARTTTAPDGTYSFGPRPPGNYEVSVATPFGNAATTALLNTETNTIIDFHFEKVGMITGTVRNISSGEVVPGAKVELKLESEIKGILPTVTTVTGADGTYAFKDLFFGNYTVNASFNDQSISTQNVTITFDRPEGIADFQIKILGTIRGTVKIRGLEQPVANATVNLYDPSQFQEDSSQDIELRKQDAPAIQPTVYATTVTDAEGKYLFTGLELKEYYVATMISEPYYYIAGPTSTTLTFTNPNSIVDFLIERYSI